MTHILVSDSQLDAYKRGAFLEKADRFGLDKIAEDLPIPTHSMKSTTKPAPAPSRNAPNLIDRYTVLQKKVEDVEKIHKEDKRLHRGELDRLKLELVNANKLNADLTTRLDKQKKHEDALDARISELAKLNASDKSEIKELRVKLRTTEHERAQLVSKHAEMGDLKKGLQSADLKRKEEVRERDKKIAELEKALATEKKRREMAEVCCMELRSQTKEEVEAAHALSRTTEASLLDAQRELARAQRSLETCVAERNSCQGDLELCRDTMARMAEAYSILASSTVSKETYCVLQYAHAATQWHSFRLERKLANVEGQVVELAYLLRQMKEDGLLVKAQVRDAYQEIHSVWSTLPHSSPLSSQDHDLERSLSQVGQHLLESALDTQRVNSHLDRASSELYRILCDDLLSCYTLADSELVDARKLGTQLTEDLNEVRRSQLTLTSALKKENQVTQELKITVQKHLMAEEGLRAQIDSLTSELASTEQLQESYQQLSDEVGDLLAKNALAEDVAQQLSKFNAEILGHRNPAQRIMYLERIRNELAESRQKLLTITRERDALLAQREELVNEVDMYKSVAVYDKPRTLITRVNRVPLSNLNQSSVSARQTELLEKPTSILDMIPDTTRDDMTLDELTT
ncbi:hypothetical protein BDZ89DRAFT_1126025 [Hymenopellis radicata]|nr:hypothetical protein BDZ89DRAFT_1126025 [Hymenopellis radicata]